MFQCSSKRNGQSLIEFALFIPIIALLLSGLSAFGFLLYAHVQVANAAREGARAGSLFLADKFHYTASSGSDCWGVREWVENAIEERTRDASGCPTGANPAITALGFLSPAECTSATSGTNCWWLDLAVETGTPNFTVLTFPSSTTSLNVANTDTTYPTAAVISPASGATFVVGNQLRVNLTYRYNVPFFGSIFNTNPITVKKTVIMRIQGK